MQNKQQCIGICIIERTTPLQSSELIMFRRIINAALVVLALAVYGFFPNRDVLLDWSLDKTEGLRTSMCSVINSVVPLSDETQAYCKMRLYEIQKNVTLQFVYGQKDEIKNGIIKEKICAAFDFTKEEQDLEWGKEAVERGRKISDKMKLWVHQDVVCWNAGGINPSKLEETVNNMTELEILRKQLLTAAYAGLNSDDGSESTLDKSIFEGKEIKMVIGKSFATQKDGRVVLACSAYGIHVLSKCGNGAGDNDREGATNVSDLQAFYYATAIKKLTAHCKCNITSQ